MIRTFFSVFRYNLSFLVTQPKFGEIWRLDVRIIFSLNLKTTTGRSLVENRLSYSMLIRKYIHLFDIKLNLNDVVC